MKVELAQDAERNRLSRVRQLRGTSWAVGTSTSLVEAVRMARDLGWKDKKVQVRREEDLYHIEPFEKDCGCPNILRYRDYFE